MKRLNTCLHVMYLVLVISAMVNILSGNLKTGWSLFLIGFLMWCALFGIESKQLESHE